MILAGIENFKDIDGSMWPGMEENFSGEWDVKEVKRKVADGSIQELVFVPDLAQEELAKQQRTDAALDAIPKCTAQYVEEEIKRTGATAEEVINDYIAIVEKLLKDGEVPE